MDWFKGKSTGNHGLIPIKYGGFLLKCSHHPVLCIKNPHEGFLTAESGLFDLRVLQHFVFRGGREPNRSGRSMGRLKNPHGNFRVTRFRKPPYSYIYIYIWVNYKELTTSSLEIIVSKGNHPQMALIQVREIL